MIRPPLGNLCPFATMILLFVISVCCSIAGAALARDVSRWGFSIGTGPHEIQEEAYFIELSSVADRSPVPSIVELRSSENSRALTFGLVFNSLESDMLVDLGANLRVGGGYLGGDLRMEMGPRKRVGGRGKNTFNYFGGLVITGIKGNLGQVGSALGDEYLEAPDGTIYQNGSDIDIWGFTLGLSAGLQYIIEPERKSGGAFFIKGGWQASAPIEDWHYTVSDGTTASELPASGFGRNPANYHSSGWFMSVGGLF